ncbi:MAG: bacillithiol biosynthesis BshC [Planctomycetota bacterium]
MVDQQSNLFELLRSRDERASALLGKIAIESAEVIEEIGRCEPDPVRRKQLLEALRPGWEKLELPLEARKAIERLEDPQTRIVIAGQQPALWGGPLLGISKAISVVVLAKQLETAGIPAVPLFWVADDDHDAGELDPGYFLTGKSPGNPHVGGRRPLFDLRHRQLPEERLAALSDAIGDARHGSEAIAIASSAIASGPAQEYVSLLSHLLIDTPLLPVLPRWLRKLQRPIVERVVQDVDQFRDLVAAACQQQQSMGIPAPVGVPRAEPFFVIDEDGLRRRPGEVPGTVHEIVAEDPQAISPDALLRTIVQDQVIAPAAVILGPTEFCYTLETRMVRQQWGLCRPLWLPRPGLRPVDRDAIEAITAEGIDVRRIGAGVEARDLIACAAARKEAQDLADEGTVFIDRVEALASRDDASDALRRRSRRLARNWRQQLERLEQAIERGLDGGVEETRERIDVQLGKLFPGGLEPERHRNLLDLIAHEGPGVIDQMRETLEQAAVRWDGSIHQFFTRADEESDSKKLREEQHDGQR